MTKVFSHKRLLSEQPCVQVFGFQGACGEPAAEDDRQRAAHGLPSRASSGAHRRRGCWRKERPGSVDPLRRAHR
nr:MAG TPA: hypothetical protein [Caudoviricetes sp.]